MPFPELADRLVLVTRGLTPDQVADVGIHPVNAVM
jgi:hypothetical protein